MGLNPRINLTPNTPDWSDQETDCDPFRPNKYIQNIIHRKAVHKPFL